MTVRLRNASGSKIALAVGRCGAGSGMACLLDWAGPIYGAAGRGSSLDIAAAGSQNPAECPICRLIGKRISTPSSSDRASAARSRPTASPRRACRSACSSAGRPTRPGSFPRSPWEIGRNFWDPSEGMHGLWDVWSFRGLGGIVSSGLGGGSLVYSNVILRKDRSTFVKEDLAHGGFEYWPVDYDDLEPHYERHEQMLVCHAVPVRPASLRPDVQDAGDAGGGGQARARVAAAAARDLLRRARRRAGRARARRPAQPARAHSPDLPALRRVQHRLQLRQQEHARLHLPLAREHAARRADQDTQRGEVVRSGRRRLRDRLRRSLRGRRGGEAHAGAPSPQDHRRPARALRRHLRDDLPPAEEPRRLPGPERQAGDAPLRQRRHPDARARVEGGRRPAPDRRSGLRRGDHEHGPGQGRRRGRAGPGLLHPGRRASRRS